MAKNLSDSVTALFSMFNAAIGNDAAFEKICNDTAAMLGRCQVTTNDGEWKAANKFQITAKDSHKVQLPPNSPNAILFHFALRMAEIARAGEFVINCSIPKQANAYVEQTVKVVTEVTTKQ